MADYSQPGIISRLRGWLFPHAAERDPGFRAEIQRLSVRALYIIAAVNIVMPAMAWVFHGAVNFIEPIYDRSPASLAWSGVTAVVLLCLARVKAIHSWARPIALASGWVAAMLLTWGEYLEGPKPDEAQLASLVSVVVVLLVGVATIPALPIQIVGLGVAIGAGHYVSSSYAVSQGIIPPVSLHHYAGLDLINLLCAGLSATLYQRLLEMYRSRNEVLATQARLLVSDNAATLGRFAATLSHELNSPLGSLSSALDSLQRVEERRNESTPAQIAKLDAVSNELLSTSRRAVDSLHAVTERMARFTNLDRAETLTVDIGSLLEDVTAMLEPELHPGVRVELDCSDAPTVTLKPQQMSAVFSRLLRRAVEASGDQGVVRVSASGVNSHAEIVIQDEGPPLTQAEAEQIFEPGFRVRDSRISGGNWSLFNSRQAVRSLGGDIQASPGPDRGAVLTVNLPL